MVFEAKTSFRCLDTNDPNFFSFYSTHCILLQLNCKFNFHIISRKNQLIKQEQQTEN